MSSKVKLMLVYGTRPDAVKMCPLVRELKRHPEFDVKVCLTGQHRELLRQINTAFEVVPDYDLDIMEPSQTLSRVTVKALEGLETVMTAEKPDMVLVHGDTTTGFAGSLAAFYQRIPVAHVEAGLRSFDKYSPWPEEMNRLMIGRIAELHFAPTVQNARNLHNEGINRGIYITGNTVIDAMGVTVNRSRRFDEPLLEKLDFSKPVIVLTSHRRENYGEPMENIDSAAAELAEEGFQIVYPVHPSPYVRETAEKYLGGLENALLVPPLGVLDMHNLLDRCSIVMTDSGGLQEEAPAMGKPVLVLRRETERPEAVEAGTVKLAGTEKKNILSCARNLLYNKAEYEKMAKAVNPYGDGRACERIAGDLKYHFGLAAAPADDFSGGLK